MTVRRLAKCEHCKNEAHQKLEHHYPYAWGDDIAGIGYVRVYFTFSCETCGEALLYHAGIPGLHLVDEFDVAEYFMNELDEYDEGHQFGFFYLVWPARVESGLPLSVPQALRDIYAEALSVRKASPSAFAVQIRRGLEAICIDQGKAGTNLNEDLKKLSQAGVFPPIVAEIAHELRKIGIVGAHVKPQAVENDQVQAIDGFFHLVVNYVYEAPASLEAFRKRLTPELPEITSDDAIN